MSKKTIEKIIDAANNGVFKHGASSFYGKMTPLPQLGIVEAVGFNAEYLEEVYKVWGKVNGKIRFKLSPVLISDNSPATIVPESIAIYAEIGQEPIILKDVTEEGVVYTDEYDAESVVATRITGSVQDATFDLLAADEDGVPLAEDKTPIIRTDYQQATNVEYVQESVVIVHAPIMPITFIAQEVDGWEFLYWVEGTIPNPPLTISKTLEIIPTQDKIGGVLFAVYRKKQTPIN